MDGSLGVKLCRRKFVRARVFGRGFPKRLRNESLEQDSELFLATSIFDAGKSAGIDTKYIQITRLTCVQSCTSGNTSHPSVKLSSQLHHFNISVFAFTDSSKPMNPWLYTFSIYPIHDDMRK